MHIIFMSIHVLSNIFFETHLLESCNEDNRDNYKTHRHFLPTPSPSGSPPRASVGSARSFVTVARLGSNTAASRYLSWGEGAEGCRNTNVNLLRSSHRKKKEYYKPAFVCEIKTRFIESRSSTVREQRRKSTEQPWASLEDDFGLPPLQQHRPFSLAHVGGGDGLAVVQLRLWKGGRERKNAEIGYVRADHVHAHSKAALQFTALHCTAPKNRTVWCDCSRNFSVTICCSKRSEVALRTWKCNGKSTCTAA